MTYELVKPEERKIVRTYYKVQVQTDPLGNHWTLPPFTTWTSLRSMGYF